MTEVATEKPETIQKASVSLSNLKHALKVVSAAIERTATIPILQCIRMDQQPEGLMLEATNLDMAIRVTAAQASGLEKPVVVPAEKMIAWTKLLSGEGVNFSFKEHRATLQCGRARAVLPTLPAANWPQCTFTVANEGITLKQAPFARALRFIQMAISSEESRYTLNGGLVDTKGDTMRFVATDGHRMMIYSIPCEEKITNLLIPQRFIKTITPLLSDEDGAFDLAFDAEQISIRIPSDPPVQLASRKIRGQFPNWEAVVPSGKRTELIVKSGDMLASLERCLLLSDERSCVVKFTFDEQITLDAASTASGEARETVDCQGKPETPFVIGVNGEYVADLLKRLDGDVTISLPKDGQSALLFKATPKDGETLDYVVMPMRL